MGSQSDAMDRIILGVRRGSPGRLAVRSRARAETCGEASDLFIALGSVLSISDDEFCPVPKRLGWASRIPPEKGLEHAVAADEQLAQPLVTWGAMQDEGIPRTQNPP